MEIVVPLQWCVMEGANGPKAWRSRSDAMLQAKVSVEQLQW